MAIPDGIKRKHIDEAIRRFDDGVKHSFGGSTKYDLVHKEKRYPPKAIIGIAAEILTGKLLKPREFWGGEGTQCFQILRRCGYEIRLKPEFRERGGWMFLGNPIELDIVEYITAYSYIYLSAPLVRTKIEVGDPCFIWRSGEDAGVIAIGHIAEAPVLFSISQKLL